DLSAHVYRSLFDTARQYRESFEVYGSQKSVEWPLIEGQPLVVHTAKKPEPEIPEEVHSPDYAHLLPAPIQRYTTKGVYDTDDNQHLSFTQGAGHGGSHPHLVHEFVSALVQNRSPFPNARQSANITCVGILAHESALQGGKLMELPDFTFSK
ncbi:MAG: gfo/Idh/MocA family oxidoreductase, partial [Chitinophagaceae bacterium]|nr:gfo/Idh/MocA family oxidoreductase [Chitinophagaceae bacterium]